MDISAHKVTPAQRMQMIELGLSPNDLGDIRKYLKGGSSSVSIKEKQERIKTLLGPTINANLGHGRESDADVYAGMQVDLNELEAPAQQRNQRSNPADVRKSMERDMDSYARSTGNLSTGGLMNLRESNDIVDVRKPKNNSSAEKAKELGEEMATEYYNSFIMALQRPSTNANVKVFKALKTMLEQEKALQGSANLQHFQEAVRQITSDMYTQIKG